MYNVVMCICNFLLLLEFAHVFVNLRMHNKLRQSQNLLLLSILMVASFPHSVGDPESIEKNSGYVYLFI